MLLCYTYTLTAVVRNTLLGFRMSANCFLPAAYNFDFLVGSAQGTVTGKIHLERQGICKAAVTLDF